MTTKKNVVEVKTTQRRSLINSERLCFYSNKRKINDNDVESDLTNEKPTVCFFIAKLL